MKQVKYSIILFFCCFVSLAKAQQTASNTQTDITTVKVLFWLDKYYLTDSAKNVLDEFIDKWKTSDSVIMQGYCDYRASFAYNDILAENRIKSVEAYLKAKGFNKTAAYIHIPHGKRVKLDFRQNEKGYAQNRAVVIKLKRSRNTLVDNPPPPPPPPVDTPKVETPIVENPPVKTDTTAIVVAPPPPAPPVEEVKPGPPTELTDNNTKTLVQKLVETLKKAKPGESFVVTGVNFIEGRHVFVKSATPILDAVAEAMKQFPAVEFEVQGHVCCTDDVAEDALDFESQRFDLSTERAEAVFEYLVNHGVAPNQLAEVAGYGSRKRLIFPEKTEGDRNHNRRVEFKILKR